MGFPEGDGPTPGPSSTVTYPPVLSVLARDHETQWGETAGDQVTRAVNSLANQSTFGPNPTAQKFAAVYEAAKTEYTATLRGIRTDLQTAAQNLALAAQEMRDRDENAGAAFVTLLSRWTDPQGFDSTQQQEQSRTSDEVVAGAATMADIQAPAPEQGTDPDATNGDGTPGTSPDMAIGPTPGPDGDGQPSPTMTTGSGS